MSFHRPNSSPTTHSLPTHSSENTHPKRGSSSTLHLKNPSTSSPIRSPSLFKPILGSDAQNHPSTHGPAVACKPLRRPIPCPRPPPTHPLSLSFADPSLIFIDPSPSSSSSNHLHRPIPRSNQPIPSNQVLWIEKSPPNTDRSLDPISTSLDLPLSFPQSLTLSSSPFLFDRV